MFNSMFICLILCANTVYSGNIFYFDNVVFGNLKRREVIPLSQINNPNGYRRFLRSIEMDPVYRRSSDIRTTPAIYTFELTQSEIGKHKRAEKKDDVGDGQNELRWLTIGADDSFDNHPGLMYIGPQ